MSEKHEEWLPAYDHKSALIHIKKQNKRIKELEAQLEKKDKLITQQQIIIDDLEKFSVNEQVKYLKAQLEKTKRRIDNIKIRAYELGSKELHNMALDALIALDPLYDGSIQDKDDG
jgi:mRNA deadenylase 3'-5' endonuclease subunit Ccr4